MKSFFILRFLFGFILLAPLTKATSDPVTPKVFPVPPTNENSLFYIQRTKNTNAIIYEVNRLPDGKINTDAPVKVYWLRYATDSTTEGLTYIQRKYAYGIEIKQYDKKKNTFVLQLVAYKKRNLFLIPTGNNKYTALMNINGKFAEIKRIFVSISGGTFWFPKVDYIELTGKDPTTQQKIVERFVP
jgi:hypothetical protein